MELTMEKVEYRGLVMEFDSWTHTVELSNDMGQTLSIEDMDRMHELAAFLLGMIEEYEGR